MYLELKITMRKQESKLVIESAVAEATGSFGTLDNGVRILR